jgi:hypothetical protein
MYVCICICIYIWVVDSCDTDVDSSKGKVEVTCLKEQQTFMCRLSNTVLLLYAFKLR